MKKQKIEIPDYSSIDVLEDEDLIKLGDSMLEALKQKLGAIKLFVVYKSYGDEYDFKEVSIEDICFANEYYEKATQVRFRCIFGQIQYIFKDKKKAEEYCSKMNIDSMKKRLSRLEEEINKYDPIKLLEKLEQDRTKLLKQYTELKEKIKKVEQPDENLDKDVKENV